MTYPGAPSIYYGDEIGMTGGHDPLNRGAFPWDNTTVWDTGLLHEFQRLIALRKERPALRRGSFRFLLAEGDVIAYARQLGGESVIVAINAARGARGVDLPVESLLPEGTALEEAGTHAPLRVEQGRIRGVDLAPRSGRVFATPVGRSER
jgi:neopullulanase